MQICSRFFAGDRAGRDILLPRIDGARDKLELETTQLSKLESPFEELSQVVGREIKLLTPLAPEPNILHKTRDQLSATSANSEQANLMI